MFFFSPFSLISLCLAVNKNKHAKFFYFATFHTRVLRIYTQNTRLVIVQPYSSSYRDWMNWKLLLTRRKTSSTMLLLLRCYIGWNEREKEIERNYLSVFLADRLAILEINGLFSWRLENRNETYTCHISEWDFQIF
jgi:hypothetical protein